MKSGKQVYVFNFVLLLFFFRYQQTNFTANWPSFARLWIEVNYIKSKQFLTLTRIDNQLSSIFNL